MGKKLNLTGQVFGRLTVIKEVEPYNSPEGRKVSKWLCQCSCSNTKEVIGNLLRSGNTTSCGCLQKEQVSKAKKTHGLGNHRLYDTWKNMNARCNNPEKDNYKYYGGKGVYVCPEWHEDNPNGLANFVNDMEASYVEGYQLDKDIKAIPGKPKCYSKNTCCWVSRAKNCKARNYKP